jgi:hypothetical protein
MVASSLRAIGQPSFGWPVGDGRTDASSSQTLLWYRDFDRFYFGRKPKQTSVVQAFRPVPLTKEFCDVRAAYFSFLALFLLLVRCVPSAAFDLQGEQVCVGKW